MAACLEPADPKELTEALAQAASAGRSIELGGRFTKSRWGGPVATAEVRISTARMTQVLEYEPRDLTISVQAGMPYSELTALLYKNRQMIPLDPPYPASATVGGVLAANHSGPRRRLYGTARDLVIGMQFATLEGKLIQSGGMVVKNVAGLDMGKLMIGSWGTLAAIATVNFKLIPRDRVTRTFLLTFDTASEALAGRNRILQGVLQPAALDLLNPPASRQLRHSGWLLAVATGGNEAMMDRYRRELASATVLEGDGEREFWHSVQTFPELFLEVHPRGGMVRISTTHGKLGAAIESHQGPAIARAANGIAYLFHSEPLASLPPCSGEWPDQDVVVWEVGGRDRAAGLSWPSPGEDLSVMQEVKQMLDPRHLLNRGRLYGRI
jgi:glycolate oxidase FAD binding subunit